jgi:hypothetical protein
MTKVKPTPNQLRQASLLVDFDPSPDYQDLVPSPDRYLRLVCSRRYLKRPVGYAAKNPPPVTPNAPVTQKAEQAMRDMISYNRRVAPEQRYKISVGAVAAIAKCSPGIAHRVITRHRAALDKHHQELGIRRVSRFAPPRPPVQTVIFLGDDSSERS